MTVGAYMHAKALESFDKLIKVDATGSIRVESFEGQLGSATRIGVWWRLFVDRILQLLLDSFDVRAGHKLHGVHLQREKKEGFSSVV